MRGATYIGSPCKHGHKGKRYVNSRGCVACIRRRARAYRQANPEVRKPRAPRAKKSPKSPEQIRAIMDAANARRRVARANDPSYRPRANAYNAAWQRRHPLKRKAALVSRRAREKGAPGRHTEHDLMMILFLQSGRCAYCSEHHDLHLDHVIPLARGGSNWAVNLQFLCRRHNLAKGALTDQEFRAKSRFRAAPHPGFRYVLLSSILM